MPRDEGKQRFEPVGDVVSIFQRDRHWYANFQLEGKQHRPSLKTTSKKEARRRAIQLEAEILQGRCRSTSAPAAQADVVRDYQQLLRTERRAKKTLVKYDKVLQRLLDLAGRRGVRNIHEVNLKVMDAYRSERVQAGAAAKTIYTESEVVRELVNFALSRDMLATDPLKGLKLKKPRPTRQPCWTYEQVRESMPPVPARSSRLLCCWPRRAYGSVSWPG